MEKQIEEAAKQYSETFSPKKGKSIVQYSFEAGAEWALSQQSQQPDSKGLEVVKKAFSDWWVETGGDYYRSGKVIFDFFTPFLSPQSNPVVDTDELKKKATKLIQDNVYRHYMDIANDDLENLPWAIDKILELFTSNLTNTSDGDKSDAVDFLDWLAIKIPDAAYRGWGLHKTADELYKEFKSPPINK